MTRRLIAVETCVAMTLLALAFGAAQVFADEPVADAAPPFSLGQMAGTQLLFKQVQASRDGDDQRVAAEKRASTVFDDFQDGKVSVDEVLGAYQRRFDAQLAHARSVCELYGDTPRASLIRVATQLDAANTALFDARRLWNHLHNFPELRQNSAYEAAARETYFEYKSLTQGILAEFLQVQDRIERATGATN